MNFKPLTSEKTGTIYLLLSKTYENILVEYPGWREPWQRDWRVYDAEVSSRPDTVGKCGFFSYVHDELVGFASFDPRGYPERARIGHNCILPAFQGKGYGVRQLRELLRILREKGFRKAVVTTGGHEFFASALRMYKCCGFRETGRKTTDAVSGSGTVELARDLSTAVKKAEEKDSERV